MLTRRFAKAARIRAARHYQKPDDPVLRLSRRWQPKVAATLKAALMQMADLVPVDKVAELIRHGHNPATAIEWGHFREVLKATFGRLEQLHREAAQMGARKISASFRARGRKVRFVHKDVGDYFTFDALDRKIQERMRRAQDTFIVQMETDARDTIDAVIMDGSRAGASPLAMAENIRDTIGLADRQGQAVLNYERMLRDLDPDALARRLRNTEYDAALEEAIDSGEDLSEAAIERMVDDYYENYIDYRAETIARTEATRTAHAGLHDAYSQAIERGALPDEAVRREWQLNDQPCPICESIPDNNEEGVGVDEDFDSDDGPVTDPPVHPNCECSVDYVTDLTMLDDEAEDNES